MRSKRAACARRTRSSSASSASRAALTGESVPVKALRQQIRLMAPTNGRVLIYGESGTGKELIARAIHAESLRRDRVFVELNCAAIPEDHIEAELFGYRHGAHARRPAGEARHPGARRRRHAVSRRSRRHEPEDPGQGAARARRAAVYARGRRRNPLRVDVRLIAATNKDLEEEIAKGNFREDLFYRLNVVPFFVPPLRERKEDIPLLAREFLSEFGRQYGRPRMEISEEALRPAASTTGRAMCAN